MNLKTILTFSIGPIGVGVLGLITMPIIAWKFSADDVALYSIIQLTLSFSFVFLGLGSEQAFVRDYNETSNKHQLLFDTNIASYIFIFLLLGLLLFFEVSVSGKFFNDKNLYLDIYIYVVLISNYFLVKSFYILRMRSEGTMYSVFQLMPKVFLLIGVILVFQFPLRAVKHYLFYVQTFALVVTAFAAVYFTRAYWHKANCSKLNKANVTKVLRYSLPLCLASIGFWGLCSLDRFMLLDMATTKDVAIYALAMNFCAIGLMLNMIFATVWTPIVYQWVAEKAEPKKIYAITKMVFAAILLLFCLTGMFSCLVPYILPSEYSSIESILTCGMFFSLLYGLSETTVVGLNIKRKTQYILIATLISFCTNFLLNLMFIPKYGYAGASISTAISMFVFFVFRTEFSCYFWKGFKRKILYFDLLIILIISITQALNPLIINYSLVWVVLLGIVIYRYKHEFKNIYYLVKVGVVKC